MDFAAEEVLCQQAYEVWLHYACPLEADDVSNAPWHAVVPAPSLNDAQPSVVRTEMGRC